MRKIVILSILMLSFLFVGAVSAAPSQDIYVSITGNDTSNTGANLNSPYATLNKSVSDVNESRTTTIHLGAGTFTGTGNKLVEINKAHRSQDGSLTIIGAGYNKTFIDGGNNANIFDVKADSIVKLVNITFINGKNQNGGTIISTGDLNISKCIFENSYATTSGGAIYSTSGNLTVSDSIFNNNTAASYGGGGAIYATSTSSNISNSSFTNNHAVGYGGALYIYGSQDKHANIKNSYFANNYAIGSYDYASGGSIYLGYGSLINNQIINSSIINATSGQGGALFLSGTSYLQNNTMVNCSATVGNHIYIDGSVNAKVTLPNLTVTTPKVTVNVTVTDDMGNTIYNPYTYINLYADDILLGSSRGVINGTSTLTFTKLLDNGSYKLTGTSSNFNDLSNIVNGTLTVNIDRTPVYLYVSPTGSDESGDGSKNNPYLTISKAINEGFSKSYDPTIYIMEGTYSGTGNTNITVTNIGVLSLIGEKYNKTIIDGENQNWAFDFDQYTQVNLVNLTITKGYCTSSYPIYTNVLKTTANLNITDCIFENNYGLYNAIIYADGSLTNVKNLIFKDNQVSGSGNGPSYIRNGTIDNSSFINNSNVGASGGAMYGGALYGYNLIIRNSEFINNSNQGTSYASGGAIYVNGALISINNTYSNNYAREGGALFAYTITSINDTFSGNNAVVNGGAFYGNGNITNATFTNNTAGTYGGAIYANGLNISNSSFANNTAGTNGNEIYIYSSGSYTGSISAVNLTFVGNGTVTINKITGDVTATVTDDKGNRVSGGYVSFYLNGTYIGQADVIDGLATLTYIGFKNGTYTLTGTYSNAVDPVYTKDGVVKVTVTELDSAEYYVSKSGNDTTGDGSKAKPFLTIQKALTTGLEFSRNIIIHLLTGVYSGIGNTNLTLPGTLNITIVGEGVNKSVIDGENVNWIFNVTVGDGLITLENLRITNGNFTSYAGASPLMVAANSTVVLRDVDIDNSYGLNGGAMINNGNLTVYNSNFSNNQARPNDIGGGAIYNSPTGILKIYNSSFVNNSARYGTAITNSGILLVKDSLIKDNFRSQVSWYNGKAIYGLGSFDIINCTFTNNDSGDIFIANTGNIYNSTFYNNTADNTINTCLLISTNANVTISNCSFTNVYKAITLQGNNLNVSVVGCLFENDTYAFYSSNLASPALVNISNSAILSPVQITGSGGINLTADYNWWGSNDRPVITGPDNLTLDYWLIMTLTADDKPGFSKNIRASMDHYTDGVINYAFDGYLPVREYVFSVSDGTINPISGNLVDNIVNAVFNAGNYGNYTVSVTIDNQNLNSTFELFQVNSTTTVGLSNSTGKKGDTLVITVVVKDKDGNPINDGEVEFLIGNTSIGKVKVVDGKAVMEWVVDGASGECEINARYLGSEAYLSSENYAMFLLDTVAPVPKADVKGGSYNTTKKVTLTATDNQDSNPKIYYTLDGTIPTTKSVLYGGPISISKTTILKFITVDNAGNVSPVQTEVYTIDTAKPSVTSIDPANGATKISASKTIKVTFNEAIKAGSKFWVDLKNSSGKAVQFKYSISGKVLTIDPTSNLAESLYTLIIHSGAVIDLAGNPVALKSSKFSVGSAPNVSKVDPKNGATKVTAGKTIKVTFSEAIKAGTKVWIELKNSSGKAVSFNYSISGKVLTIDPKGKLAESLYTLCIHTGAVTDLAGNPVALKSSKFSVGTAPTVSKIDPKNGATKVARNKTIKLTFNENIKAGSNWVELKTSSGKAVKINSKSISGKVLTIKHAKLAANTKYKLTIHTGAVTDKAGNPVAVKTCTFITGKT